MGQKTGTSNTEKKVITKATHKAFVMEYLHKGRKIQLSSNCPTRYNKNFLATEYLGPNRKVNHSSTHTDQNTRRNMYINSANNNLYFFSTASHLPMHVCIIVFLACKMEIIWPEILSWENTKFRNQIVFVLS